MLQATNSNGAVTSMTVRRSPTPFQSHFILLELSRHSPAAHLKIVGLFGAPSAVLSPKIASYSFPTSDEPWATMFSSRRTALLESFRATRRRYAEYVAEDKLKARVSTNVTADSSLTRTCRKRTKQLDSADKSPRHDAWRPNQKLKNEFPEVSEEMHDREGRILELTVESWQIPAHEWRGYNFDHGTPWRSVN
jgi:hypothetical protein